ncbi:MAG: RluA family pseudouridine synthase, partial [Treponema sp.]|nr:RluA family pseudouridine synthase [Treponema sp.]
MEFREFTAGKNDDGRRLDRILQKIMPETSSSGIYSAIRKKLIRINGSSCRGNQTVSEGDVIKIAAFLISEHNSSQENYTDYTPSIDCVFMNEHILIINKESGISVQPGGKGKSLWEEVIQFYGEKLESHSISFKPGPLHRLDRFTSGLVAFSLSLEGAKWFTEAMQAHSIKKDYLGIVRGCLKNKETWTDCIEESETDKNGFHKVKISQSGEKAVTEAIPLSFSDKKPLTLVQFKIHTGKKHQIRCQSAFHGFPLYGDTAYDTDEAHTGQKFFLHAFRLSFPKDNPVSLPEHLEAPLPQDFEKFLSLNLINWDR